MDPKIAYTKWMETEEKKKAAAKKKKAKPPNKRTGIANDKKKGAKVNPKTGKVVQARPRPNKRSGTDYVGK